MINDDKTNGDSSPEKEELGHKVRTLVNVIEAISDYLSISKSPDDELMKLRTRAQVLLVALLDTDNTVQ